MCFTRPCWLGRARCMTRSRRTRSTSAAFSTRPGSRRDAEVPQLHLCGAFSSDLRRSSRPAERRRPHRQAAVAVCRHQVRQRAVCLGCSPCTPTASATIGLRYFNEIFGKRQDPYGAYAAVIPKWTAWSSTATMFSSTATARRAATSATSTTSCRRTFSRRFRTAASRNQVDNVAVGDRTTLNAALRRPAHDARRQRRVSCASAAYGPFRTGDVRHSQANVEKAERLLGYGEKVPLAEGLARAMPWYIEFVSTTTTWRCLRCDDELLLGVLMSHIAAAKPSCFNPSRPPGEWRAVRSGCRFSP